MAHTPLNRERGCGRLVLALHIDRGVPGTEPVNGGRECLGSQVLPCMQDAAKEPALARQERVQNKPQLCWGMAAALKKRRLGRRKDRPARRFFRTGSVVACFFRDSRASVDAYF
jgi:hypothetical protein